MFFPIVPSTRSQVTALRTDYVEDGTNDTNYGLGSMGLGSADTGRRIIIIVHTSIPNAVTIGGVSATLINSVSGVSAWIANPTGTTGNLSVQYSPSVSRTAASVWKVTTASGDVPEVFASAIGTTSVSVAGVSTGAIIGGATGSEDKGFTWSGATESYDSIIGGESARASGALKATPADGTNAVTLTSTNASTDSILVSLY